jgi:flagellar basal-body rod modification protein FlgD
MEDKYMSILEGSLPVNQNYIDPEKAPVQMMKDDFLKLLIAQLQHQDPLNPMEAMEFTSQLSQLAQLEQMYQVNDNLNNMHLYQIAMNNLQAADLIGKDVKAKGNLLALEGDDSVSIYYQLNSNATSVTVRILDDQDRLVRVIEIGSQQEGSQIVQWDGNDGEGNALPDGIYHYEVMAVDSEGNSVAVEPMIYGKVTGLSYEMNGPVLNIGPLCVPLGDIYEISEAGGENGEDGPVNVNENS